MWCDASSPTNPCWTRPVPQTKRKTPPGGACVGWATRWRVLRPCKHQRKRRPGERAALVLLVAAIAAPGEEKQDEEVTSRAPEPMCFFTHCDARDILTFPAQVPFPSANARPRPVSSTRPSSSSRAIGCSSCLARRRWLWSRRSTARCGNEQWFYKLDKPCTDGAKVATLGVAIGSDAKGLTRYVRLPGGANQKPAHGRGGFVSERWRALS